MKKTLPQHIIALLMITFVGGFSFTHAQLIQTERGAVTQEEYCKTSNICGTASKYFTLLMDFVREMMNSIHTIGTEGDYVGQYVNPNWFVGDTFTPPPKTIVGTVARNVEQKIKFGLASTAIFSTPANFAGLKDMLGGVVLLTKNEVFLRDEKLVEELDSQVTDKRYELGLGGGRYDKVNATNLKQMQSIIDTYVKKGLFVEGSRVLDGVSYNNITSILVQLLSSAKSFLYFDSTSQFDEISRGGDNGIVLIFNDASIQMIKNDYNCARGWVNTCDSPRKSFNKNMKTLASSTKNSWSKTKTTFSDAIDNLGQTFTKTSDQTDEFKARQQDLFTSMYGTTKVSMSTGLKGLLIDPIKKTLASAKKSGAEIVGDITGGITDVGRFRSFPKDIKGVSDSIETTKIKEGGTTYNTKNNFANIINGYLVDVFTSQTTDIDLASFAEVKDITPAFDIIGKQIYAIKTDILGGKQKDNSLLKSLGTACELQCGRGGTCR